MRKNNVVMFTKYQANFLSVALKQPKPGSRNSGTPVLVEDRINPANWMC